MSKNTIESQQDSNKDTQIKNLENQIAELKKQLSKAEKTLPDKESTHSQKEKKHHPQKKQKSKLSSKQQKIIFSTTSTIFMILLLLTLFILPDIGSSSITKGPLIEVRTTITGSLVTVLGGISAEAQRWVLTIITTIFALISSVLALIWRKQLKLHEELNSNENNTLLEDQIFTNEEESEQTTTTTHTKEWHHKWHLVKPFIFFALLIMITIIFPDIIIQIRTLVIATCLFLMNFEIINILETPKTTEKPD